MTERVIVLGAGGHALTIISTLLHANIEIVALYDDDSRRLGDQVLGIPVVGTIETAPTNAPAIMAIGDNRSRKAYVERTDFTYGNAVHPNVAIAQDVTIAEGAVLFSGAVVQPSSRIGPHAIVGAGAVVSHDNHLGAFTHIGPGATLAGDVTVRDVAFVGTGASVIPGIVIGEGAIVGAGAVVVRDVPAQTTVVGNPARPIRR